MYFEHSADIWRDFPHLVPGALYAEGITSYAEGITSYPEGTTSYPEGTTSAANVGPAVDRFTAIAKARLTSVTTESELPEIQAWRRAFAQMGLKPTQYRCASESLLRRFRLQGSLPVLHPLVDLCNAISLAYAIPVAVLDVAQITGPLEVRYATGDEEYLTFAGDTEHPSKGEVVFADQAGHAHARRWTNRQSGRSAVRDTTRTALIVAEALHDQASHDVPGLIATLAAELKASNPQTAILTAQAPRFAPEDRRVTQQAPRPGGRAAHASTSPRDPPVGPVREHHMPSGRRV